MRLELQQDALDEYAAAVEYYDQRQPGLGEHFIARVEEAFGAFAKRLKRGRCWWRTSGGA